MRITIEYKPEFSRNKCLVNVGENGEKLDEFEGTRTYENAKSISDGSDLFSDFIEIRMENDENGGRKKVYIARETIKKIEIHEK